MGNCAVRCMFYVIFCYFEPFSHCLTKILHFYEKLFLDLTEPSATCRRHRLLFFSLITCLSNSCVSVFPHPVLVFPPPCTFLLYFPMTYSINSKLSHAETDFYSIQTLMGKIFPALHLFTTIAGITSYCCESYCALQYVVKFD